MAVRKFASIIVVAAVLGLTGSRFAAAENRMGYRLLDQSEATGLPRGGAALGLVVERAQQITDGGLTFDIMRASGVRAGSAAERAGFHTGDDVIAVDGLVFPTIAAFAAYVGSRSPGGQLTIDYIPSGGSPAQAQRVTLILDNAGGHANSSPTATGVTDSTPGMSMGKKVAIGAGAAALLGCYELGCFSHHAKQGY